MLDFLFRRLTAEPPRGAALFEAVSNLAREPHWFIEGKVPDTLDGRFAVLATVTALVLVRMETEGAAGDGASVALTERFVEIMEAEHRELGLGDPTLGKTVRKLVGSLARRTELWRSATRDGGDWSEAALQSLYKGAPQSDALRHSAEALKRVWGALRRARPEAIALGDLQ